MENYGIKMSGENNLLKAALYYAENGIKVFPVHYITDKGECSCGKDNCKSKGKHPFGYCDQNGKYVSLTFKNASSNTNQIKDWWCSSLMQHCNIGIPTGPENNLSVLDIDVHKDQPGLEEFEKLKERHLLANGTSFPEDTPVVQTASGGYHIYFKYHNDVNNSSSQIATGLDTRGKGGYVVAPPSSNIAGKYTWTKGPQQFHFQPCPQIIADELLAFKKGNNGSIDRNKSSFKVKRRNDLILNGVPEGQRDEQIFKLACSLKGKGHTKEETLAVVLTAAQNCTPPFPTDQAKAKVESAFSYNSSNQKQKKQLVSNGIGTQDVNFVELKGNRVLNTINNLKCLLDHYDIKVRYNEMSKEQEIFIPNVKFISDTRRNNEIAHIESLCCLHAFPTSHISQYLGILAKPYHPVREWIESKPWDGKCRYFDLMDTVECESEDIKELYISMWLISAVAALYEPTGVSAQGVLIFSGSQGVGKTRWLKSLVGEQNQHWCKEGAILSPGNKDSVYGVITKWLVELGEMESTFKKSDVEQLKAFITKDYDELRLPYERKPEKYPRRTVFFGSVNSEQFLVDNTGNRRYWTLKVDSCDWQHNINMQQLWAEIYEKYKAGEEYHLRDDELEMVNEENKKYELVDPFEEVFFDYYVIPGSSEDKHPHHPTIQVHASDIYRKCFDTKNPTRKDVNNAIKILSKWNIKTSEKRKTKFYHLKSIK